MLPDETQFIGNAIGIDPSGCGCDGCTDGSSIPEDDTAHIAELIEEHFTQSREIINRTGSAIVVYQSRRDEYEFSYLPESGHFEVEVINQHDGYFDDLNQPFTVVRDSYTPPEVDITAVDVHNDEELKMLIEKHFREGVEIINRTSETLVVYRTGYGESGYLSVDADTEEPLVSVIYG